MSRLGTERNYVQSLRKWFRAIWAHLLTNLCQNSTRCEGHDFDNPSRHLGSLTAANWVSFDFNVAYFSCWRYSLINTLKVKKYPALRIWQKPTSTTLSIIACAPGSRRTKSLQTVTARVVPGTASSNSARGIGDQASAGAAVDEELRQAGKTSCRHRVSGLQESKYVGFRRGIPFCCVCLL